MADCLRAQTCETTNRKRQRCGADPPAFTERPAWRASATAGGICTAVCAARARVSSGTISRRTRNSTGARFSSRMHRGLPEPRRRWSCHCNKSEAVFAPLTAGFYRRGEQALRATRSANQRHQFLTVEMSFDFLRRHLGESVGSLHPLVREVVAGRPKNPPSAPRRLTSRQQQLLASLREAPVLALAQSVWYQAKALEVARIFLRRAG